MFTQSLSFASLLLKGHSLALVLLESLADVYWETFRLNTVYQHGQHSRAVEVGPNVDSSPAPGWKGAALAKPATSPRIIDAVETRMFKTGSYDAR